jgi:hypothetical protein
MVVSVDSAVRDCRVRRFSLCRAICPTGQWQGSRLFDDIKSGGMTLDAAPARTSLDKDFVCLPIDR